jgi:hypothetical protein
MATSADGPRASPPEPEGRNLNRWLRTAARANSLMAIAMMIVGYLLLVTRHGGVLPLPGEGALPFTALLDPAHGDAGTLVMSAGILLLGLLPVLNILLILGFFLAERAPRNAAIAAAVLLVLGIGIALR